jgi:hypothetical protein
MNHSAAAPEGKDYADRAEEQGLKLNID